MLLATGIFGRFSSTFPNFPYIPDLISIVPGDMLRLSNWELQEAEGIGAEVDQLGIIIQREILNTVAMILLST
jgi:hypothetical protein